MNGSVIYALLYANDTLKTYIGDRIFPSRRLQTSELPAITYNFVSNVPLNTKDGESKLDIVRVQINVFSESYDQAATIKGIIRSILDRYSGISNSVLIDSIVFADEQDLFEDWADVYHHTVDFLIRVKR